MMMDLNRNNIGKPIFAAHCANITKNKEKIRGHRG